MRSIPIIATLSVISTVAFAQNMDTVDKGNPNRPGHDMRSETTMMKSHRMTHHERVMHKSKLRKKMENM